ncbi:hypothetical protein GCM10010862_46070 [Devosia nitrariae]|uniref:Uncharacterized protein n=1 Tax=Devosia nitrariae TaxID=2071872 RepID=A0ABQ5WBU4_9HYPH|nr:hypothetical protein GCM10010862_46070 [Devosia nitrariae]
MTNDRQVDGDNEAVLAAIGEGGVAEHDLLTPLGDDADGWTMDSVHRLGGLRHAHELQSVQGGCMNPVDLTELRNCLGQWIH